MALGVFWGGLFYNSCIPLELSLNWCTHNCAYCFANLNMPGRKADTKQIFGLLSNYKKRTSYEAWLLQEGYPVAFSNHVDPFAVVNEDLSLGIIELFALKEIPFTLQTKGGRRLYDALDRIDTPIVWYVSVTTLNEEIARKVEPGAPPIHERLKMIEKIIAKGHQVCVGINPCVPDWLPNPKELTDRLVSLGVWGAVIQSLHLSSMQLKNIPKRGQNAMGERVLHQALYRKKHPEVHHHYLITRQTAKDSGLQVYNSNQPEPTEFFKIYKDLYPKRFPLYQDFVNYSHQTKIENDAIYFEEYLDYFLPQLPKVKRSNVTGHIYAKVDAIRNDNAREIYGQIEDYETLLISCWQYSEIPYCPVNLQCFCWAADWEVQENGEEGWTQYLDDNDRPILVFQPNAESNELFVQWEPVPQKVALEV